MLMEKCGKDEQDFIFDKLIEYNLSKVSASQREHVIDLSKKIVENGEIVAGVIAHMYYWKIVQVDILWVDSGHRGKHLGSMLLNAVEKDAKNRGARLVLLDTFDFQAKDFYEKKGYRVFGTVNDCPENHSRFYLEKRL